MKQSHLGIQNKGVLPPWYCERSEHENEHEQNEHET
jgi:hypothetical protein